MVIHYWYWVPVALLAALGASAAVGNRLRAVPEKTAQTVMTGFAVTVFLVYFVLGWWKLGAFQYGLWDFGIYDSMMHNMASGKGFMQDFRGGLYDHFSPVMVILLPLYRICDTPLHLVWFQSAAMAAGIPVMYFLAKKYLRGSFAALTPAILYVLNPYYSRLVLFDFHSECMFPALFMAGFLARAYGKRKLALALWMSCIFIKEDFVIPLAGLGLFFLVRGRERKEGAVLLGWSVLAAVLILKVYFPWLSEKGYWHYGRYELLAPTFAGTVENFGSMLYRVFRFPSWVVLSSVLLPFALLPVLHGRMFFWVLLPALGIQLASAFPHQNLLMSHYGSALTGVAPVAALWGLRAWRARGRRKNGILRTAAFFALIAGGILHTVCCDLPMSRYHDYIMKWEARYQLGILSLPLNPDYYRAMLVQEVAAGKLQEVLDTIPDHARIVCQNELGVPLLRRCRVMNFPGTEDADFYLFDKDLYSGFDPETLLNETLIRLSKSSRYRIAVNQDGILLFVRMPEERK